MEKRGAESGWWFAEYCGEFSDPKGKIVVLVIPLFVFAFYYILQLLFYNLHPQGDKLQRVIKKKRQ